jgi:hypothetical protein
VDELVSVIAHLAHIMIPMAIVSHAILVVNAQLLKIIVHHASKDIIDHHKIVQIVPTLVRLEK